MGCFSTPPPPPTITISDVTARRCPRSGGAEAEQDGCVLGSGELRQKGRKGSHFRQTRHLKKNKKNKGTKWIATLVFTLEV